MDQKDEPVDNDKKETESQLMVLPLRRVSNHVSCAQPQQGIVDRIKRVIIHQYHIYKSPINFQMTDRYTDTP